MSDIEIAQNAPIKPISEIAAKLDIPDEALAPFGHTKAKVSLKFIESLDKRPDGKLILVTAITPTPAGEGKTTTSVGLTDGLNKLGKKAMVCLREPSLGPCFGMKARVIDFNLYRFSPIFHENLEQIQRVEELSDAYHFVLGEDEHVMVMYLLEVRLAEK